MDISYIGLFFAWRQENLKYHLCQTVHAGQSIIPHILDLVRAIHVREHSVRLSSVNNIAMCVMFETIFENN